MKFKTEQDDFKNIIEVSEKLVNEIKFECDREGIRFSALDHSHICFIRTIFDADYFDEYECEEPTTLILDTKELVDVFKRKKSNDTLTVTNDEGNVIIIFEGEAKRTFRIRLVDMEYDNPPLPQIEYINKDVEVDFKDFIFCLKDATLYDAKIHVLMGDEKVTLYVDADKGSYESQLVTDPLDAETESIFSIDYLLRLANLTKLSNSLLLSNSNTTPLFLTVTNLLENVKVNVLLAPRIEEEY